MCRSSTEWPILDWLLQDFFPALLQLACMLPCQEQGLRTQLCKVYFLVFTNLFIMHHVVLVVVVSYFNPYAHLSYGSKLVLLILLCRFFTGLASASAAATSGSLCCRSSSRLLVMMSSTHKCQNSWQIVLKVR
jgi:hypothetical protein